MTISANYAINQNMGNGTTTTFAVNFPFGRAADLAVTLFDTVAQANVSPAPVLNGGATYDYTVSGTPDPDTGIYPNGSIVFNHAPLATHEVVCARATQALQQLALNNNTRFPAKSVEGALDRAEMELQELANMLSRVPLTPASDAPSSQIMPPVNLRKGKLAAFDDTTGALTTTDIDATDLANVPAEVAAAEAAAASVAANLAIIQSYGAHKGANNFFDVCPSNIVTAIQARDFGAAGYLDTYQAIAEAAGGAWIYPPGEYHWNATRSLPAGFRLIGVSRDVVSGTVIFTGGSAGQWGGQLLNANGTNQVEGYSLEKAFFQVTQNGFRWNSATGGFDDTSGTQAYMMRPRVIDCGFNMDSVTRRTCLQFNKCFDTHITDPSMNVFMIDMEFNGCDNTILDGVYRSDMNRDTCLLLTSQNTFGNTFVVENADLNQATNNFIRSTQRKLIVRGNHMEIDGNQGGDGSGGKMSAAIYVHGNAFETIIDGNSMDLNGFADNWLKVDPSVNTYLISAHDNVTASAPSTMGSVNFTSGVPLFNNSNGPTIIRHGGNYGVQGGFPFSSDADAAILDPTILALWSPGRRGAVSVVGNPLVVGGAVVLPPASSGAIEFEISDFPTAIVGNGIGINICCNATVNAQQLSYFLGDGGGTFQAYTTIAIANTGFQNYHLYLAAGNWTSGVKIRLKNVDTGHGGNVLIRSVSIFQP